VLGVFRRKFFWRPVFTAARWLRGTGVPGALAGSGRLGFGMGMLAASEAQGPKGGKAQGRKGAMAQRTGTTSGPTVALFRGCVMDTLFRHVHDATRRTLAANGYVVIEVPRQTCCGALHEHAGDRATARALLAANASAFRGKADYVVVNSAGCGALLKEAAHFEAGDAARELGDKVRDVSELLAEAGPRPGGELPLDVAYDAPCHLEHAQGVRGAPLALLGAVPGLRIQRLPGSDRCCGSAGIYSLLHPAMARAVLDDKVAAIAAATPRPALVVTGNPGCLMQIGAGLRAAKLPIDVAHPVEVLDWSYAAGGDV
jgi:glycolate oxidase iron-sulfur subunit